MIQDSQPLASRGRRTITLALSVFIVAGLILWINRSATDDHAKQLGSVEIVATASAQQPGAESIDSLQQLPFQSDNVSSATLYRYADSDADSIRFGPLDEETIRSSSVISRLGNAEADSIRAYRQPSQIAATTPRREEKRSLLGPILAVLLLAIGTAIAVWLKRTKERSVNTAIRSIARLQLSQNQEVRLIRVRGEEILIGATQSALTVLHNFGVSPDPSEQRPESPLADRADTASKNSDDRITSQTSAVDEPHSARFGFRSRVRASISVDPPIANRIRGRSQHSRSFESLLKSSAHRIKFSDATDIPNQNCRLADRTAGVRGVESTPNGNGEVSRG